ncbi:acetyl-CoA carboxylase biotin carboxyl carrier protein [Priestia taiwanensis]|uniref:Biotin carboxyl carrier protein of acetyl-CoA carboxylase n=1 Tax=Priestia taiwanensis TaxID=1347902 RepID=A0A917AIG8_9BACI|nr:acetyl-CoA carboxylase biotin carboxyl carrier protein [Priestia taiwanensis]MBM7361397.1 acetyl-CoA carboxylase biotin carboxyl carrier protein [Priestia taiwanensis]GGE53840.1 acetyl-CoA carboxylase, biotin carboxyl carrier protein [Priestia taiwanensis]
MRIQEVRELIRLIDQSNIDEFEYEYEGAVVKIKKNSDSVVVNRGVVQADTYQPVEQVAPIAEPIAVQQVVKEEVAKVDDANLVKVTSPMVGTFYASPTPDADAYVSVGQKVSSNTVVCIVEAMKLFNEIEAEVDGEVVEILVKDGQLVEYGQPLFLVKK